MAIRIVLADDHTVVLDGLRLLLESEDDLEVLATATDGLSAVQLVEELNPDIIVMDIGMPGLNGIEAALRIQELSSDTRIIFLSMHASPEHIYRALRAGAKGYVVKESAGTELKKAVRTVYNGSRYLSEPIIDTVVDSYSDPDDHHKSPLQRLSCREREVLQLVVEGRTSVEIAERLFLSTKTIDTYRSRLMQKLGVEDITGLVRFSIQHGLTSLD